MVHLIDPIGPYWTLLNLIELPKTLINLIKPQPIEARNPAKLIKMRFNDSTVESLLSSKWWEYDIRNHNLQFDNAHKFIEELGELITLSKLKKFETEKIDQEKIKGII